MARPRKETIVSNKSYMRQVLVTLAYNGMDNSNGSKSVGFINEIAQQLYVDGYKLFAAQTVRNIPDVGVEMLYIFVLA